MLARVIIQVFDNGQKNVCFTQDATIPLEDFLVYGVGAYTVVTGEVLILTDNPDLSQALLEIELRSVDNVDEIVPDLGVV